MPGPKLDEKKYLVLEDFKDIANECELLVNGISIHDWDVKSISVLFFHSSISPPFIFRSYTVLLLMMMKSSFNFLIEVHKFKSTFINGGIQTTPKI